MGRTADNLRRWWTALVNPDLGGELVVGDTGAAGFERFLIGLIVSLYAFYGVSMGLFRAEWLPPVVSAVKMPMLYMFSLAVCFYPLYVLNVLFGPQLRPGQCLRLLLLAISANAAAVASYAPLSIFFTITTSRQGYSFLILMHVAVLALAAMASLIVIGVVFRATARRAGRPIGFKFMLAWGMLYAFVGTQMSWLLRPWLGSWSGPYEVLRPRGGSFIEAVWALLT
ncbi:hypothetical protein LLG95_15290 [bacterium]|nr:hypothetical protein [bacterium]